MSVKVIHGKPGSGKTCYCVSLLVSMFCDWARYENEKSEPYPGKLYTNIPLDIEAINAHLTDELGFEADLSESIEILGDDFFRNENGDYCEWWEKFDPAAYIVIDEVHYYLPASIKRQKGGQQLSDKFSQYISTHRKKQHEIVFITQHVNKISAEVRKDVETLLEVLNVKNRILGIWPFTIPMSDIDVVRESFGMQSQLSHIRRGVFDARSITYDKNCEVFLLRPWLFELYRSHSETGESFDRPSLKLGKAGAILWFCRRHVLRLTVSAVICVTVLNIALSILGSLPTIFMGKTLQKKPAVSAPNAEEFPITVHDGHGEIKPHESGDTEIIGFVRGGVITPGGVLRKDDHLIYEGEKDYVKAVDIFKGVVHLGSGRMIKK